MPYASPIYSSEERKVHHNNSACTERNNIERKNVRQGTGGFPLCNRCKELNRAGK